MSTRNTKIIMFLGSKVRRVRRALLFFTLLLASEALVIGDWGLEMKNKIELRKWKIVTSQHLWHVQQNIDRLCGLVVRVPGYRSRGPGFYSQRYQIFWAVVGLEQGPLSLVSTIEELLERKSSISDPENRDYDRWRSTALTTRHPSIRESWH
jgi:hypothetical protein